MRSAELSSYFGSCTLESHDAGAAHSAFSSHPETSTDRASSMIVALTEGVKQCHFPANSRSDASSQPISSPAFQAVTQLSYCKRDRQLASAGAIPASHIRPLDRIGIFAPLLLGCPQINALTPASG